MHIIGIILWLVGLVYALGWGFVIRQKARSEQATEHTFEVHALLLVVSLILIPVLSLSPFHLLWMFPASFVLGLASVIPPLNLLWLPASLYGFLWYIGTRNPGRAAYLAGDYQAAIQSFNATIRQNPNSAETHFYLASAYGKIGDKQKQIESLKECIQLDRERPEAHFNLGATYREVGNSKAAIESFTEAIRIVLFQRMWHRMDAKLSNGSLTG